MFEQVVRFADREVVGDDDVCVAVPFASPPVDHSRHAIRNEGDGRVAARPRVAFDSVVIGGNGLLRGDHFNCAPIDVVVPLLGVLVLARALIRWIRGLAAGRRGYCVAEKIPFKVPAAFLRVLVGRRGVRDVAFHPVGVHGHIQIAYPSLTDPPQLRHLPAEVEKCDAGLIADPLPAAASLSVGSKCLALRRRELCGAFLFRHLPTLRVPELGKALVLAVLGIFAG